MLILAIVYGRLPVYAFTIILASLFELGCALAPSMPALIVLRFIAGFFSAAPLSNGTFDPNQFSQPLIPAGAEAAHKLFMLPVKPSSSVE